MEWGIRTIRMWFSATGMFPDSLVHVAPLLDAGSFPDSSPHWFPLDFAGQQCVTPRCPEAGPAGNPWPDVRCSWCWRHRGCRLSCAGRAEGIGSCHGAAEIDARGGAGRVNPELAWSEMKRIKTFLMENFHFHPFENLDGIFYFTVVSSCACFFYSLVRWQSWFFYMFHFCSKLKLLCQWGIRGLTHFGPRVTRVAGVRWRRRGASGHTFDGIWHLGLFIWVEGNVPSNLMVFQHLHLQSKLI